MTKAVAYKSLNTVLEHILIEAAHGTVTMKCTDMVLSIQSEITATVKEKRKCGSNGAFYSMRSSINTPMARSSLKTEDNNQLSIACGHSKAALNFYEHRRISVFSADRKKKRHKNKRK